MSKRFDSVQYNEVMQKVQLGFKILFSSLAEQIEKMPQTREQDLALNKLEESYMWVGKMLRNEQIRIAPPKL